MLLSPMLKYLRRFFGFGVSRFCDRGKGRGCGGTIVVGRCGRSGPNFKFKRCALPDIAPREQLNALAVSVIVAPFCAKTRS